MKNEIITIVLCAPECISLSKGDAMRISFELAKGSGPHNVRAFIRRQDKHFQKEHIMCYAVDEDKESCL